jgi:predicted nucleotidyltransferase
MNAKFQEVFDSFVQQVKLEPSTKGILFFGSAQQGKESPSSDLDFNIVVDSDEGWNFKRLIHGVPVEAYFLPKDQWRKLLDESPHVLKSFATGTIVYDTDSCLRELAAYAKKKYDEGPEELSDLQKANWRITLTEICRDLEGQLQSGAENPIFSGWAISKALEGYCALARVWADKTEKLVERWSAMDSQMKKLIEQYNDNPSTEHAKKLVEHILDKHGGPITEYEGPRIKYRNA